MKEGKLNALTILIVENCLTTKLEYKNVMNSCVVEQRHQIF